MAMDKQKMAARMKAALADGEQGSAGAKPKKAIAKGIPKTRGSTLGKMFSKAMTRRAA